MTRTQTLYHQKINTGTPTLEHRYGGHRKWQGDEEDQQQQQYQQDDTTTSVDEGGYLDDLWKLNIGNDVSDISFTLRVHVGGSDINVDLLGTWCSSAKCENNSHPCHFLISLTRNNTTRML